MNLLKMKALAFHQTELCSQSPVTLSKLSIKNARERGCDLCHGSVSGKTGLNAHFTSAATSVINHPLGI